MNRYRPLAVAALTGILTAVIVVTALTLVGIDRTWSEVQAYTAFGVPIFGILLALALVQLGPYMSREAWHWAGRPFGPLDAFLLAVIGTLLLAPRWSLLAWGRPMGGHYLALGLAILTGLLQLLRWMLTLVRRMRATPLAPTTGEGALLDKVVGHTGLEALADIDAEDSFDRRAFVDTLEAAVRHPRQHSFTFGLNGPWGSGKTSVLNALERRLKAHGAITVRFDAWSFREPERIVANYLAQLETALREAGGAAGLGGRLRAIGLGIAPLAGSRVADVARNWLSAGRTTSVRATLEELRTRLRARGRIIAIIVDDLDRLERDELHAALRTLRLLANLPGVVHVLAYDRRQVERILFPDDATGKVARDYIAKIVHVELSLSTPTSAAVSRVLSEALQPLFAIAGDDEGARFSERLNSLPRKVFVEAMPTPREIRRVAATTALVWPGIRRDVNIFDLFILQLIHARYSRLFGMIHLHPEWFTEQEWSADLWRISEGKRWEQERDDYVQKLRASDDPDDINAIRLLGLIFPSVQTAPARRAVSEAEARRDRRICHPLILPRYFQLSVPRESVAESTVEDLATRVKGAAPEVRAALVEQSVEDAARSGRVAALFDQWDVFVDQVGPGDKPLPYDLARDICLGVARASSALTGDYNDPMNPRRTAAFRILKLADRAGSNQDVSRLLAEVIRECPSFAVSGLIVLYTTRPDRERRALPERALDERMIRGQFDQKVAAWSSDHSNAVFQLDDDDLAAILYRTETSHIAQSVFFSALSQHPDQLPRLLAFAVRLDVDPVNPDNMSVYHQDLAGLHAQLPLDSLFRSTERLATEFWDGAQARALVRYFRDQYQRVIAETNAKNAT